MSPPDVDDHETMVRRRAFIDERNGFSCADRCELKVVQHAAERRSAGLPFFRCRSTSPELPISAKSMTTVSARPEVFEVSPVAACRLAVGNAGVKPASQISPSGSVLDVAVNVGRSACRSPVRRSAVAASLHE